MWIKGKKKRRASFPYPPKHHPYTQFRFSLKTFSLCKPPPPTKITIRRPIHSTNKNSSPRSTFSLQPETNLFGKLRAVQEGTTHTVSEHSTAGGRQTHTHAHTHTLTKWRLWQKFPLPQKLLMNLITTFLLSPITVTSFTSCVYILTWSEDLWEGTKSRTLQVFVC